MASILSVIFESVVRGSVAKPLFGAGAQNPLFGEGAQNPLFGERVQNSLLGAGPRNLRPWGAQPAVVFVSYGFSLKLISTKDFTFYMDRKNLSVNTSFEEDEQVISTRLK